MKPCKGDIAAIIAPFQGFQSMGFESQGDAFHASGRKALPWADFFQAFGLKTFAPDTRPCLSYAKS